MKTAQSKKVSRNATSRIDKAKTRPSAPIRVDSAAEWMDPRKLKPWAGNPRANQGEPVARVVESIKRFGFGAPIVARAANLEIIAGHTRALAAIELGMLRVPVRLLDISAKDAHVLALADNRYVELTPWAATLPAMLTELDAPDLQIAGWDASSLAELLQATTPSVEKQTYSVFDAERIADEQAQYMLGKTCADLLALSTGDIMIELNRCANGGKPLVTVADRWFPHRYDVLAGKSPCTPNESLRNADTIRATCGLSVKTGKGLTVTQILQVLLIFRGRQAARQFPIHVARDIYRKHAPANARVLDPCAGWGGRLLGWHCAQLRGSYEGYDASAETCAGHAAMLADLKIENARVTHAAFEDVRLENQSYDFAFTSPPYFSVERYSDDDEQSCVRYSTYDAWRSGFLAPLVCNTLDALKPGAAFAVNVSDAGKHTIAEDVRAIGKARGATVESSEKLDVGAGCVGGLNTAESIVEDLIVLRKGK